MSKLMFAGCLCVGALLAGCGNSTDASEGGVPSGAARDAAQTSYEIVTVTRPENVEQQLAPERALYNACTAQAEAQRLPVKPFPAVPRDYFTERSSWASDGQTFMSRIENYGIDMTALVPEQGCSTRFTIASSTEVHRGKKVRSVEVSHDGERNASDEEGNAPAAPRLARLAAYTAAKTVAGHKVRCMPATGQGQHETCVPDAGAAMPASYDGSPITVHLRMKNAQGTTDLVMMPQTLRIGAAVDPAAFGDAGAR